MKAVVPIVNAYEDGAGAILLTGRELQDLDVDANGRILTVLEGLRRSLRSSHGLHLVTYAPAEGIDWDADRIEEPKDRSSIEALLRRHGLLEIPLGREEAVRVIRGVSSLSRTPSDHLEWHDGRALRIAFLLMFTEHLAPGAVPNGMQTDQQLTMIELAFATSRSLALRATGHFVIFHGQRDGLIDDLVVAGIRRVCLAQPDELAKLSFIRTARQLYPAAQLDVGLTDEGVARLTCNTPNRGNEALLRASHRVGRALTAGEFVTQKAEDVVALSEGTLTLLDDGPTQTVELYGRNVASATRALGTYAAGLERGDASTPANVLLIGPPGVGKTIMAVMTAHAAHAAAYNIVSPKSGIVGETERKARLQQQLLDEWQPLVGFIDEVTEAFQLERSDFDGDSGASKAVSAAMHQNLANDARRGKSLIIATTNCPYRMGAAMRSRFVNIPVLYPVAEDFPGIVASIAHRLDADAEVAGDNQVVQQAARIFFAKRANPRHIMAAVTHQRLTRGALTSDTILEAAENFCGETDESATILADLWAICLCSLKDLLPWHDAPETYPFPPHLEGVVDRATGEVDRQEIRRRIRELQPEVSI